MKNGYNNFAENTYLNEKFSVDFVKVLYKS